ncbi:hypothetical protein LEN_4558 [Lysobacter enzymogenes]|uniref:Uncharacterized protein n=1 Tax=Lysobacter enzymogenes TaxID=69 RepID=A0AAU9ATP9_LYSEN|nr:hypothetical protein LEN_4558 [Lysobacter enzymogenes]
MACRGCVVEGVDKSAGGRRLCAAGTIRLGRRLRRGWRVANASPVGSRNRSFPGRHAHRDDLHVYEHFRAQQHRMQRALGEQPVSGLPDISPVVNYLLNP